jgi:hypothetical protein
MITGRSAERNFMGKDRTAMAQETTVVWRQVINDLKDGKVVDIPVDDAADTEKKQAQVAKRASRHGFEVESTPVNGMLRVKRASEVGEPAPDIAERHTKRNERREQRQAGKAEQTSPSVE